ncbi:hypothetical protein BpHYR1_040021 [Brachionus plicatilis]|uniref:Uncharacterized protein n=1 Tax=Brachionus plicatilis TaxID=10195 RepID=A0A3M7T1K1_BRAPC|nr:hypothetical protein BpHYR1_040021 [Brachionus plicatilis]
MPTNYVFVRYTLNCCRLTCLSGFITYFSIISLSHQLHAEFRKNILRFRDNHLSCMIALHILVNSVELLLHQHTLVILIKCLLIADVILCLFITDLYKSHEKKSQKKLIID